MTRKPHFDALATVGAYPLESEDERIALTELSKRAAQYLVGFRWCAAVEDCRVGFAVPDVLGLFLCRIRPARPGVDDVLWVVHGDLPPAYLVVDDAPTPATALVAYVNEMRRWVDAVRNDRAIDDVIPVNVEPTREHADMLDSRLRFVEEELIPLLTQ